MTDPTPSPGIGARAAAWFVDAVVGFLCIGIPVTLVFGTHSSTNSNGVHSVHWSLHSTDGFAAWLVLAFAYYVLFEWRLGATPGKFALKLRVQNADGTPVTFKAALIRNALRVVDGLPYVVPYLVGAIAIGSSATNQRLGDHAAKTLVVYR